MHARPSSAAEVSVAAVIGAKSPDLFPVAAARQASPIPAVIALAVVLLAAGGWLLYRYGWRRSRLAHRSRARRGESILPAARSALFPPSHHETLHDPAYLDRILRAERDNRRHARRKPVDPGSGDSSNSIDSGDSSDRSDGASRG